MELIVAVYADWGIGCSGTQPIALSADRKFFREITKGCMVLQAAGLWRISPEKSLCPAERTYF